MSNEKTLNNSQLLFSDMKVAEYYMDSKEWGSEDDPFSNWSLVLGRAPFVHKEACEFILALSAEHLQEYEEEIGLSEDLMEVLWDDKTLNEIEKLVGEDFDILDELVHEVMAEKASLINNDGIEAQVKFLLSERAFLSTDSLIDYIKSLKP